MKCQVCGVPCGCRYVIRQEAIYMPLIVCKDCMQAFVEKRYDKLVRKIEMVLKKERKCPQCAKKLIGSIYKKVKGEYVKLKHHYFCPSCGRVFRFQKQKSK